VTGNLEVQIGVSGQNIGKLNVLAKAGFARPFVLADEVRRFVLKQSPPMTERQLLAGERIRRG
jgi:hypothetical protein